MASAVLFCGIQFATTPASSQQIDPSTGRAAPNIFAMPNVPDPELLVRYSFDNLTGMLRSADEYAQVKAQVSPLRLQQAKSPSGLWVLTHFNVALRSSTVRMFSHPPSQSNFETTYQAATAVDPADPLIHVVKANVLHANAVAALSDRAFPTLSVPVRNGIFFRRLEALWSYMDQVHDKAASDPGWYQFALYLISCHCIHTERLWDLIEEGSTRFPDYYQFYFEAINVAHRCNPPLRAQAMELNLKRLDALAKKRLGESEADAFYARAIWYVTQLEDDVSFLHSSRVDWPRMRRGIDIVLSRYPDAWNTNNFAKFACAAQDAELTRRLMPLALALPIRRVWQHPSRFASCWEWSGAVTP